MILGPDVIEVSLSLPWHGDAGNVGAPGIEAVSLIYMLVCESRMQMQMQMQNTAACLSYKSRQRQPCSWMQWDAKSEGGDFYVKHGSEQCWCRVF